MTGEAHDFPAKAAETDGTKRALATFRKTLRTSALSEWGKTAIHRETFSVLKPKLVDCGHRRLALRRDDTTPIPRPSRYYGRRQDLVKDSGPGVNLRKLAVRASADTSIIPSAPDLIPARIDQERSHHCRAQTAS